MTQLVDTYGRMHSYLRISVTDRCNLKCIYCTPREKFESKKSAEILSFEEIERASRLFADLGVTKIRLTGGEPLVRRDLPKLIHSLVNIPGIQTIGITTNGVLLKSFAHQLKQAGLTNLNVSLDTLRPSRFETITSRQKFNDILEGIYTSLDVGFQPLKLNVVVMGGINDDEIPDFVRFVREKSINVRFIEYMPFKSNRWTQARFVPFAQMKKVIERQYELIPVNEGNNSVAKDFMIEGFAGTISFITPMSDHFCGGCNRIRMTADGSVKLCLFYPADFNIRESLRDGSSDENIKETIKNNLWKKPFAHPSVEEIVSMENGNMIEIGG